MAEPTDERSASLAPQDAAGRSSAGPRRLLVLEPDSAGDALESMLLRDPTRSFEVETLGSLSAAFERLARGEIQAVLLDPYLSDSQGVETVRKLRLRAPEIPIVVVTASEDEHLAVESLKEGAQDFFRRRKVDVEILVRSIQAAMHRHLTQRRELEAIYERRLRAMESMALELVADDSSLYERQFRLLKEFFGYPVPKNESADATLLRGTDAEKFAEFVEQYEALIEHALEHGKSNGGQAMLAQSSRALAQRLAESHVTPRDVVEIHATALVRLRKTANLAERRAYLEEGVVLLIQVLACLVVCYQGREAGF